MVSIRSFKVLLCLGTLILPTSVFAEVVKPFKFPVDLVGNSPRAKANKQDIVDKSDFLKRMKDSKNAAANNLTPKNGTPIQASRLVSPPAIKQDTTNESALDSLQKQRYNNYAQAPKVQKSFIDKIKDNYKSQQDLGTLMPGANLAIPVAGGITNPIITNFKRVAVRTHDDDAVIELEDGRVYITLNAMRPIGLMLFEEGVPESMINLTLVPLDAMPVVVNLKVKLTPNMKTKSWKYRAKIKEEQALEEVETISRKMLEADHISYIKRILKPIGNATLPRGFTLSTDTSKAMQKPCSITIEQSVQQRIVGLREVVDVVRVKNNSHYGYMIEEHACESKGTIAVAIYNKAYLQPGEATEIYIVRDKTESHNPVNESSRPRVIK